MPEIDLHQKVFGVRAQTHFMIFAGVYLFSMFFLLLAFIDYSNLPPKVNPEVKRYLADFFSPLLFQIPMLIVGLSLLYCLQYTVFYGVVGVCLGVLGVFGACSAIIGFFINFDGAISLLSPEDQKEWELKIKYYPVVRIGKRLGHFVTSIANLHLSIVLCKLAFFATPPPVVHQPAAPPLPTIVIIEDKNLEQSGKSGKSVKSGKSEKPQVETAEPQEPQHLAESGKSGKSSVKSSESAESAKPVDYSSVKRSESQKSENLKSVSSVSSGKPETPEKSGKSEKSMESKPEE